MENIFLYVLLIVVAIGSWLLSYYFYQRQSKSFIQSFLDSQSNIIVLVQKNKVTTINEFGLSVFGYDSMESFVASKSKIVDYFIVEDGLLSKYTYGEKWIEELLLLNKINLQTLEKNIPTKVKIPSKKDMMDRYYHVKVSALEGSNEYIVSFTDITKLENDKKTLQKSAEYDQLTKIYNRVKLNQMIETIFFNFNKYNHKFSMILFDIDHFKAINDNFGHNVGDDILVSLTKLVNKHLRAADIFVRWGGEEFVVVLQDTMIDDSVNLASRLRAAIDQNIFDEVKHVTCSFGVTEVIAGDTQATMFERADEALYEAKETGRNRVVKRDK